MWYPEKNSTPFKCIFYKAEKQEIKPETIQHSQGNYALKTKQRNQAPDKPPWTSELMWLHH